jgi:hypothetical protein
MASFSGTAKVVDEVEDDFGKLYRYYMDLYGNRQKMSKRYERAHVDHNLP